MAEREMDGLRRRRTKQDAGHRDHEIFIRQHLTRRHKYLPLVTMFRSITSAGRAALRTGAFSRQVTSVNQQPSLFNALRAFSDDAAARTKGTVKWFGTSVVVSPSSDMYSPHYVGAVGLVLALHQCYILPELI